MSPRNNKWWWNTRHDTWRCGSGNVHQLLKCFDIIITIFVQHLSGTFNHLHLITSAEVLRQVLIKIALWSGITGKSLGKGMWRYNIEALICRLTFKSLSENSAGVNPNILFTGPSLFQIFLSGLYTLDYLVLSSMCSLCFHVQGQCLCISEGLITSYNIPVVGKVF